MTTPEGCYQPVQEEPNEVPILTGTRPIVSSPVPTNRDVDGGIHTAIPLISPSPVGEQVPVRTINNDDDTSTKEETKSSRSVPSYLSFISNPSLRKMLDRTDRELFKDFDTWLEEFDTPKKKPDLESLNNVVVKFLEEEVTKCQIDMDMILAFRDSGITSYEDYLIFMNRNIPEVVSALDRVSTKFYKLIPHRKSNRLENANRCDVVLVSTSTNIVETLVKYSRVNFCKI